MAPDYSANDQKGWCGDPKRGAAMGRYTSHLRGDLARLPRRLYLRRVYLNQGGYDAKGTYFGTGLPLYWVCNAEQTIDYVLRASDRADAKWHVLRQYPNARFFR